MEPYERDSQKSILLAVGTKSKGICTIEKSRMRRSLALIPLAICPGETRVRIEDKTMPSMLKWEKESLSSD